MTNFRVNKKQFDVPAISKNGNHYFVEDYSIAKGKLSIQYCYYVQSRRKWFQDTIHITDKTFLLELYTFALKRKIIKAIPDDVLSFIEKE